MLNAGETRGGCIDRRGELVDKEWFLCSPGQQWQQQQEAWEEQARPITAPTRWP